MTLKITRFEPQCPTCTLDAGLRDEIHKWREEGLQFTRLSKALESKGIQASADSVSNHFRKHTAVYEAMKPYLDKVETLSRSFDSLGSAKFATGGPVGVQRPILGTVTPPAGWKAGAVIEGDTGEVTSEPQTEDIKDFSVILKEFGTEFEDFEIDGSPRISKWKQREGGEWLTAYKFNIKRKNPNSFDLPTLFAEVKSSIIFKEPQAKVLNTNRTLVVPFADMQVGKVGSRGDSKSLIERVLAKKDLLEEYAIRQGCSEALFADGGDIVESFENTAQQGFTNDLSIMDQLDLAGTLEQEFISMLAKHHNRVTVAGVPSNHGAWRKGKDILGRPSDDWGLFLLKQIQKAYKLDTASYGHVEFAYPDEWRKSLNIDVQGVGVGLVHGEDSSLAQMENWWAKQVHGASPVADSDILITSHYHTLGLKPSGRSRRTGKQKYWLATPTLDNGSDWWANKSGSDSDPGLMAFVIDSEIGFDLQSFTVL